MATGITTSTQQITDSNGDPVSGAKIYVYNVGTTTLRAIYSDTGLSVAVSNPVICNSAGRTTTDGGTTVGMVYTAVGSYKIVVKDSSDNTLFTFDGIDGGVPVGSGTVAIANGGTGAATAPAALSNLGGASASDLADLAAEVAALAGAAASTEKTHIATGTTAQRPVTPIEGDIRRNTTTGDWEGYDGAVWDEFAEQAQVATDIAAAVATNAAAEAWKFISAQNASSSATIDFTGLDGTYDAYEVRFSSVKPATDDTALWLRIGTGGGPTYASGGSDYSYQYALVNTSTIGDEGSTGAAQMLLTSAGAGSGIGNAAGEHCSGWLQFDDPDDASNFQTFQYQNRYLNTSTALTAIIGGAGKYNTAAAITAIRFMMSSGNIASGHFALYGLRKS